MVNATIDGTRMEGNDGNHVCRASMMLVEVRRVGFMVKNACS
jgi:hypothetical protein